ncbi:hypothetical protein PTKIN_Ptkin03bG0133500 [Pterospermum kingtungense]
MEKKMEELTETMMRLQGATQGVGIDTRGMSLIDDLELPPMFKMPKFERYDGTKCPRTHIISYHRKMELYEKDDKVMIHCFQNSLEGSAAEWLFVLIYVWGLYCCLFQIGFHKHWACLTGPEICLVSDNYI